MQCSASAESARFVQAHNCCLKGLQAQWKLCLRCLWEQGVSFDVLSSVPTARNVVVHAGAHAVQAMEDPKSRQGVAGPQFPPPGYQAGYPAGAPPPAPYGGYPAGVAAAPYFAPGTPVLLADAGIRKLWLSVSQGCLAIWQLHHPRPRLHPMAAAPPARDQALCRAGCTCSGCWRLRNVSGLSAGR